MGIDKLSSPAISTAEAAAVTSGPIGIIPVELENMGIGIMWRRLLGGGIRKGEVDASRSTIERCVLGG